MRTATRRRTFITGTMSLLLGVAASASQAQVVIYRCTDAGGAVTLQNGTPCPKGSRQQKKVMETPAVAAPLPTPAIEPTPPPVPAAEPAVVAPPPAQETPPAPPVAAPKTPPPALFECRTWNRERYLSDVAQPPPRCAPLQVTGLDGTGAMAGGTACQMMEDECRPVPEARLCDAWKDRVRELDSAATFARQTPVAPADAERIRRTLAQSTCTP